MMRQTWNGFCEVCKLQGNKRMRQLVTEGPDLYVAEPEVTKRTDAYTKLSDFSDAPYSLMLKIHQQFILSAIPVISNQTFLSTLITVFQLNLK